MAASVSSSLPAGWALGLESEEAGSAPALDEHIRSGFSVAATRRFMGALDIERDTAARLLGISTRTLARRLDAGRLKPAESDRLYRYAHLLERAASVLSGAGAARAWLKEPQWGLGDILSTSENGKKQRGTVSLAPNDTASAPGGTPVLRNTSMIGEGRLMPQFFAEILGGERVSLESFRGKTVVINWWATSCAPCIVEMPGLNELVQKYEDRNDIVFVAVASNTKKELRHFFKKYDFAYRQTTGNDRTTEVFGAAFPRNVVVDAKGTVIYDKVGADENQHEKIDAALQEHVVNE